MPWHSVRLNLLTRFQAALPALRPSSRPPLLPSHFFLALFHILLLLRFDSSSQLYDYQLHQPRSVQPFSPWNLGWHLVNQERRTYSPWCTNLCGLPAAREAATPSLARPPSLLSSREIPRASFLLTRAGSIMASRLLISFVRVRAVSLFFPLLFSCQRIRRTESVQNRSTFSVIESPGFYLFLSFFFFFLLVYFWFLGSSIFGFDRLFFIGDESNPSNSIFVFVASRKRRARIDVYKQRQKSCMIDLFIQSRG